MAQFVTGPLFIRAPDRGGIPCLVDRGHVVEGHTHTFDHVTFLWGTWRIRRWRRAVDASGAPLPGDIWIEDDPAIRRNTWLNIAADCKHSLEAMEDGCTYACAYPHRDPATGEIVPAYTGWEKAYT